MFLSLIHQRYLDGPVDGQDGLSACFAYSRNQPGIEVFFDELKKETFEKHPSLPIKIPKSLY